jgi:acetyl-CoA carboxylase carboxyltransferase component
MYGDGVVTG